ncbi:MAG: DnaD domain protein [Paenibacillaceae bacterium]
MPIGKGILLALRKGSVSIPNLLVQNYSKLGLAEIDMMLIIHLLAFREKENNDFPTIEEIQNRMTASPERVIQSIQKLMNDGWITIDEDIDPESGIQYEHYNISGVYEKLAEACAETYRERQQLLMGRRETESALAEAAVAHAEFLAGGEGDTSEANMFVKFETEFGRPLSPMECETISGWLDQDKYAEPLILAALKEAVFAGKVHFRYIDRILLEWNRNLVRTPEQAKEYAARFRSGGQ